MSDRHPEILVKCRLKNLLLIPVGFMLLSCLASNPYNTDNICLIFEDKRGWYKAAKAAERSWGIPISVNMAFIFQESSFRARARPERTRFFWIFPGPRLSSAFGYAQALDSTWSEYRELSGNHSASRSDFDDAIDFVGWYNANSGRLSKIMASDARNLYFAYHEGNRGYQRGTYLDKTWLIEAANRVQKNSEKFDRQLHTCRKKLEKGWFQRLIS